MKWENSEGEKTCMNSYPIVAEANASVDAAVEAEEDNMGKNENTFDPHIVFVNAIILFYSKEGDIDKW